MANYLQGVQSLSSLFGFGRGLNGWVNPLQNSLQNNSRNPLSLFSPGGHGLSLGLNLPKLGLTNSQGRAVSLLRGLDENLRENDKSNKPKKDQLELGKFTERAAEQAVENARRAPRLGATKEIVVSEDGRFEASVDIRFKSDGSYELDLAVRFAESSAVGVKSLAELVAPQKGKLEGEPDGEFVTRSNPNQFSYSGAQAYSQRYTSFEQMLQTRGFEARIFFEEAQSIGVRAEQAYGDGVGGRMTSVAGQMAHEFTLNVSIRGDDLNEFNAIADRLSQFDDSGTLSGFLEAARGVLTADSSDMGAFLGAARSLLDASREHVSSKLGMFFASIDKEHGSDLKALGFGSDFFANVGKNVQSDLDRFFNVANELVGALLGGLNAERENGTQTKQLEALKENLEALREKRMEQDKQMKDALEDAAGDSPLRTVVPTPFNEIG